MKKSASVSVSQELIEKLSEILADTYVLYTKTQNFHWNVVDPRFYSLHKLFEKQYEELAEALDELAERIRMIHGKAPGSMQEFLQLTSIKESSNELSGNQMIQELIQGHTIIIGGIRPLIQRASELDDDGTMDLLTQRLRAHEKILWMLQSHF